MTIDDIIRMAQESWAFPEAHISNILEFANLIAAAEREACAMTVLKIDESGRGSMRDCAQAIRARGNNAA